jgi:hypothetical protein
MTVAYQKRRNRDRKHAALMKRDPGLREALYGQPDTSGMAPAMKRIWDKPIEPPDILQQARDRAIGLDRLYPAQSRETAKDSKPDG